MYKATRELIKARQPYSEYIIEVVSVRQIMGGVANKCFQNATSDALLAAGNQAVSGWIVSQYCKTKNSTEITHHWWNVDKFGRYFDTTPGVSDIQYVVDSRLAEFGQEHYENLTNLVACSLLYKNNKFYKVKNTAGGLVFAELASLETSLLFDDWKEND